MQSRLSGQFSYQSILGAWMLVSSGFTLTKLPSDFKILEFAFKGQLEQTWLLY